MQRRFTLEEARAALPHVHAIAAEIIELRASLLEQQTRHHEGDESVALADLKAGEARLSHLLDTLVAEGLQVKGWAPLLVDFPSELDGRDVLLCWLEGEDDLAWYHDPAHGFAGRRRLPDRR